MITKKTVEIELKFLGTGRVEQLGRGAFVGGLPPPKTAGQVGFSIHRMMLDENGILNPVMGEDSSAGNFQVNLYGTKKGYRELGRYFLALAELDTTKDDGFHEHHDDLASVDGSSHVDLIVRKQRARIA